MIRKSLINCHSSRIPTSINEAFQSVASLLTSGKSINQSFLRSTGSSACVAGAVRRSLYAGASVLAIAWSTTGQAQTAAPAAKPGTGSAKESSEGELEVVVVTGIRSSLANSQEIKREADTVVDAITAEDIGALPDRSVTESLQRVPGVAISRFAGGNDPDHFSAEGSTVVIRGLNFVRTEFNGRDTFTVSNGRSLTLSDVPSELLGSIEVYKQLTANMIEGGLAGTVNLNTRKPFDQYGFHLAMDAQANYSDFSKETTPVGSVLASNTWETDAGTFGLLADVSYSRLKSRSDGMQVTNIQTRDDATVVAAFTADTPIIRARLPGQDVAYAPIGASFRSQQYDRERTGYALAGQWENNAQTMRLTGQFLRSQASTAWGEHTFETESGSSEYNTFPLGCEPNGPPTAAVCPAGFTDYEYDENNLFERGYITLPGTGWRTATSGMTSSPTPTGGIQQNLTRRDREERTVTSDYGLNFTWTPTDRIMVNLDGQYIEATSRTFDVTSYTDIYADAYLDMSGSIPQATLHRPTWIAPAGTTPNPRIASQTDQQYFSDPANYFWRAAMDHKDRSDGDEWALKADLSYDFNEDIPFLKAVKFGTRLSDREQTVRYTAYNWGVLSEVWAGTAVYLNQAGGDQASFFSFDNFFRGRANAPPGGYYYPQNLLSNYAAATDFFRNINNVWNTQNGGAGFGWTPLAARGGVIPGTPYLPGEISDSNESTEAAYVMLHFGSSEPVLGNIRVDGNVGVRYVQTEGESTGSVQTPQPSAFGNGQPFSTFCPNNGQVPSGICSLGEEFFLSAQQFSDGASYRSTVKNDYDHWLPSLNLKVALTDEVLIRFAASKAIARPDFGYLRNFVTINTVPNSSQPFQANAGNPYLKPASARQFDLGAEWYFGRVGSLSATLFYKKLNAFFYQDVSPRDITNNGVTQTILVRGPKNFDGDGTIEGYEVAYQQTYDFLPGVLSGLGSNLNYTRIDSEGLPNSFLSNVSDAPAATPPTGRGNLPLEGLSKHNYNATVFYEKGAISARVAYSWRSRFLQTATDQIFPYFPVYNAATGQLDATLFYNLTERVKVGFQGVNLTDEVTRTLQQFTPGGLLGPRSYFINDRRYAFIVRSSF